MDNKTIDETAALPVVDGVEFRLAVGFPNYAVGDDGSVWSRYVKGVGSRTNGPWKQLRLGLSGRYPTISLTRCSGRVTTQVHRLVLEAFVGPRPEGMQACHFPDQNTANVRLNNLRWDTPSANNRDKEKHGTHQIGEKNGRAKLTASQVLVIRERYNTGESPSVVGREFGVTETLVRLIGQRKCWKHV